MSALLKIASALFLSVIPALTVSAENGYRLWLRYETVNDSALLRHYASMLHEIVIDDTSLPQSSVTELRRGCTLMLGRDIPVVAAPSTEGALVAGTIQSSALIRGCGLDIGGNPEGYCIRSMMIGERHVTIIASSGNTGALYGIFHFLRLLQTGHRIDSLVITEAPLIRTRMLNHWDNLDGTIERGYAGRSLWKWSALPGAIDIRYTDYARACASIGINGTVLNNVNTQADILKTDYIEKVKSLADIFRPWGIRVYLSARFSAPADIGNLKNFDPGEIGVQDWWVKKAGEIYSRIPDFGGFLVKAGSEGQPGPNQYDKTDADGANCLARALKPYGGVVLWRAFVYDEDVDADRFKRAYKTFVPLDGSFDRNVVLQVKNGPFDFQPREPVHPLFGALTRTRCALELQITKEYLGQSSHLVFLAPMWKEVLDFDTRVAERNSDVGSIVDGSFLDDSMSYIAGVANTGNDSNWCGHHFDQANWYAFGRMAWNHHLTPDTIAEEWARMTFGNNAATVARIVPMMTGSHEALVNYRDPLGIGGIFTPDNHYGVAPGDNSFGSAHPTWNAVYWHRADRSGIGYDRSSRPGGSNFVGQYASPLRDRFNDIASTPENLICWFHHVPWEYLMHSGRTFWEELNFKYCEGVRFARELPGRWSALKGSIDDQRYYDVGRKLQTQAGDAVRWSDTCLTYFAGFSGKPISGCTLARPDTPKPRQATTAGTAGSVMVFDILGRQQSRAALSDRRHNGIHGRTGAAGVYLLRYDSPLPVIKVISGAPGSRLIKK